MHPPTMIASGRCLSWLHPLACGILPFYLCHYYWLIVFSSSLSLSSSLSFSASSVTAVSHCGVVRGALSTGGGRDLGGLCTFRKGNIRITTTTTTMMMQKEDTHSNNSIPVHSETGITSSPTMTTTSSTSMGTTSTTGSTCGTTTLNEDPLQKVGLPGPLILGSGSFTRKLILQEMGIPFQCVVRPIDEKLLGGDRTSGIQPDQLVLHLAQAKMDHLVSQIVSGQCTEELGELFTADIIMPTASLSASTNNDANVNREQQLKSTLQQLKQRESEQPIGGLVILTGDQVVTCGGRILEKPESVAEAKRFVSMYAVQPPSTVGSCVLHHIPTGIRVSGVDTATIYFQNHLPADDLVDQLLLDAEAPILSCAGGLMIEHPLVRTYVDKIDGTEDSVMGLSKDLVRRLLSELADQIRILQQE